MEDNLKFALGNLSSGTLVCNIVSTQQMEYGSGPKFFKTEDNIIFFENGRQPQFF
jgi:hypothetical protein